MDHRSKCYIVTRRDELARLLANFPHPRNEPGQAVDALHRARQLAAEIEETEEKDGRTLSQDD